MQVRLPRPVWTPALAVLLLVGCGGPSGSNAPSGTPAPAPSAEVDAAAIVERALAARSANAPTEFAALLATASGACPDRDAQQRLGEVAAIAARWSSALLDGRPKAQKVTEDQLAAIDWDELVAPCGTT